MTTALASPPGIPTAPDGAPLPPIQMGPTCWLTAYAFGPLTAPAWVRAQAAWDWEDHTFVSRHDAEQFYEMHGYCHLWCRARFRSPSEAAAHRCAPPPLPDLTWMPAATDGQMVLCGSHDGHAISFQVRQYENGRWGYDFYENHRPAYYTVSGLASAQEATISAWGHAIRWYGLHPRPQQARLF